MNTPMTQTTEAQTTHQEQDVMTMNHLFTEDRFNEIIVTFKVFVKDKDNKPWKNETYGTQYPGKVTFEHFIFYAMLRGKDPVKTTHDPESERYKMIIDRFSRALQGKGFLLKPVVSALGMTEEEGLAVVERYFK